MRSFQCLGKHLLATGAVLTGLTLSLCCVAQTPASPQPNHAITTKNPPLKVGLAAFAKSRGFSVCSRELDALDQNLFLDSDYSLRAFLAETNVNTRPFSALIDSRKTTPQGNYVRALTNIVITPADTKAGKCTVMYEQTLYHDQHCDTVRLQMAAFAPESGTNSYGAITFDLLRNMTLTIIPVGSGQCVTVVKEVAY
ncbi:MAG: hypothetical protein LH481_10305 [Burkholderiales bacterium]|nr:hypothetical protein [Burkholderiales bacterium]